MKTPTFSDLHENFRFIAGERFNGVPGVHRIGTGTKTVIGVMMMTHGNEPSGLAALGYARSRPNLEETLARADASLVFCLNNLDAAEKYFGTDDAKERADLRYITHNMNRLPVGIDVKRPPHDSELQRAHDLVTRVYPEMTIAIDIHSVPASGTQMIIDVKGDTSGLIRHFQIASVVRNIRRVQIGSPISSFCGGTTNIPVIGVEAGQHDDPSSCDIAISCMRAIMDFRGIEPGPAPAPLERSFYDVNASVIPPSSGYRFARSFAMFEEIHPDTVLLTSSSGDAVPANQHGHILLPRDPSIELDPTEEACFLSKPKLLTVM